MEKKDPEVKDSKTTSKYTVRVLSSLGASGN